MAGFLTELVTEVIGEVAGLFTASKLGWFGKIAGKIAASPSVQETVTKKIEKIMGVDESGKTLEEELLTIDLINFLQDVGLQVDEFISRLRETERGEEKVIAFRVFLASGIKKGSRQIKEFIPNPAGGKAKPTEQIYTLLDIKWGEELIKRLLAKPTFGERVKFLEDQGVFSTMKKKREPSPIVQKVKALGKKSAETLFDTETGGELLSKMSDFDKKAASKISVREDKGFFKEAFGSSPLTLWKESRRK